MTDLPGRLRRRSRRRAGRADGRRRVPPVQLARPAQRARPERRRVRRHAHLPRAHRRPPHVRAGRALERRPPRRGADPRPDPRRAGRTAAGHRPLRHRRGRVRRLAREAVGDGVVTVLGAGAAQSLLRAGELDELDLHVVPVLLGRGRRLFDHLPPDQVELTLLRSLPTPTTETPARQALHLRYRIDPA